MNIADGDPTTFGASARAGRPRQVRRIPILVFLIALLAGAIVAGERDRSATAEPPAAREAAAAVPDGSRSVAWYCPGAPTAVADETEQVSIANTGAVPSEIRLTLYPDDGQAPVVRDLSLAGQATVTMTRAEIGGRGPFTVEATSAGVVVEAGADGAGALAFGPCSTNVDDRWLFAAGTTVRGVEQWLVIANPLGADAKIDLTLRTEEGARVPIEYQSRDVARRTRLIVPIHELAGRRERVSVEVRARVGLVVAQQTNIFGPNSGRQGVTQSLGVLAPAVETWFADGAPRPGVVVAVANPGPVDAQVEVRAYPDGDEIVAPLAITVAREGVSFVPVGGCAGTADEVCVAVPEGAGYALSVLAEERTPVVAEMFERAPADAAFPGAAIAAGVAVPARGWQFARAHATDEGVSVLALVNPTTTDASVDVTIVHNGAAERPAALQGLVVPPARRVGVDLGQFPGDVAIVVRSSVPIVAERSVYGPADMTRTAGVAVR